MRDLEIDKQKMWYSLFLGKQPILDENGDETGDYKSAYTNPVEFYISLSAGKGSVTNEMFGKDVEFTRTITTTDLSLPITETSLLWHETEPQYLENGEVDINSADYEVSAPILRGLNEIVIALKARTKNATV